MVDMVEARKRARRSVQATNLAEQKTAEPETFTPPVKPVLRSEKTIPEETSAYYPVEAPVKPEAPPPEVFLQEPVLTETVPVDQVDFIQ